MFFIRLCFGLLIIVRHGMPHLMDFSSAQGKFLQFSWHRSQGVILSYTRHICRSFLWPFVVLGLFTRLAVIPLIIMMLVVTFYANAAGRARF